MQTLSMLFWMQMALENLIPFSTFHMLCIWNLRTSLKLPTRCWSLAYLGSDPNLLEPVWRKSFLVWFMLLHFPFISKSFHGFGVCGSQVCVHNHILVVCYHVLLWCCTFHYDLHVLQTCKWYSSFDWCIFAGMLNRLINWRLLIDNFLHAQWQGL